MQGKCTDNTRPEGQVAMWCKQRNGDGEKKKRLPDLLKAFLLLFFLFLHEPNGSGCVRAALAAHAEEHEQFDRSLLLCRNPLLIAPPASALQWGEPRQSPAERRSRKAESKTGAHRPGAVGFPVPRPPQRLRGRRQGEPGSAPPQPLRPAPAHTELPTPAGEPQPCPHPGILCGAPAGLGERQATLSRACPLRIPVAAGKRATRFLPVAVMERRRRRRKERQRRAAGRAAKRAAARSAVARGSPQPTSSPAPERGPTAPLTCF